MTILDYFVVGPGLSLQSVPPVGPSYGVRLDFRVVEPERGPIGGATAEWVGPVVPCALAWTETHADAPHKAEAIRLLAGVVRKLTPADVLVDPGGGRAPFREPLLSDGFRPMPQGRWHLPAQAERVPRGPTVSVERLSDDPFRVVWNFEPRPWPLLAPLHQEMAQTPSARVLDVGCGFGKNSVLLEGWGFETHGVDFASHAIELCRRWVRHPERYRVASAEALPYTAGFFDAVLDVGCLHCLAHAGTPRAVGEIARVLRPGGRLFSRVLRPRGADWLDAQRYRVDRLGLEPADLVGLLEPWFDVRLRTDAEATYVVAYRRMDP